MPHTHSRRLIWVPVLHSQADLGSMRGPLEKIARRNLGSPVWTRHVEAVDELWTEIAQRIAAADLDYERVRLYQDGLPVCGYELEIVRELAQNGGANHQLVLDLIEKGAHLTGTESPELLTKEYELIRTAVRGTQGKKEGPAAREHQEESRQVLEKRDRFIAQRINATLQAGETGLLFLGLLHSFADCLAPDILLLDMSLLST